MAVYYQPNQQQHNNQNSQNQRHQVQEAKRPPLARFAAWVINKSASTILEKPMKFLLGTSLIGRLFAVIIVSLIIGSITDLVLVSVPAFSITYPASAYIFTPIILGVLVGAGAGGTEGAILGGLWGWLVSQIIDAIAGELMSNQVQPYYSPAITWITATITGLLVGRVAEEVFIKVNRGSGFSNFASRTILLIMLILLSGVIFIGIFKFLGF